MAEDPDASVGGEPVVIEVAELEHNSSPNVEKNSKVVVKNGLQSNKDLEKESPQRIDYSERKPPMQSNKNREMIEEKLNEIKQHIDKLRQSHPNGLDADTMEDLEEQFDRLEDIGAREYVLACKRRIKGISQLTDNASEDAVTLVALDEDALFLNPHQIETEAKQNLKENIRQHMKNVTVESNNYCETLIQQLDREEESDEKSVESKFEIFKDATIKIEKILRPKEKAWVSYTGKVIAVCVGLFAGGIAALFKFYGSSILEWFSKQSIPVPEFSTSTKCVAVMIVGSFLLYAGYKYSTSTKRETEPYRTE